MALLTGSATSQVRGTVSVQAGNLHGLHHDTQTPGRKLGAPSCGGASTEVLWNMSLYLIQLTLNVRPVIGNVSVPLV